MLKTLTAILLVSLCACDVATGDQFRDAGSLEPNIVVVDVPEHAPVEPGDATCRAFELALESCPIEDGGYEDFQDQLPIVKACTDVALAAQGAHFGGDAQVGDLATLWHALAAAHGLYDVVAYDSLAEACGDSGPLSPAGSFVAR